MNLAETLRALLRQWYIVVPGVLAAAALAFGAWTYIPPTYERTATELLLPGSDSVPTGDNPYLYISGLGQAADVVVSAVGANDIVEPYTKQYPGTVISVYRDPVNSGPAIVLDVTARSDADAGAVLSSMVSQVTTTLAEIQNKESVPAKDRITASTITMDSQGVVQNKKRTLAAVGAGIAMAALALILAAFVDGVSRRRRRDSEASRNGGPGSAVSLSRSPLRYTDADAAFDTLLTRGEMTLSREARSRGTIEATLASGASQH